MGLGKKIYSNDSSGGFISGGGGFSQGFYHKCGPVSRALEIEKLKAPLFCGPEGAGDTNDWRITVVEQHHEKTIFCI